MSYSPLFNRGVKGNHSPENAFLSVVQGEDSYRLENEFNESEWISLERLSELLRYVSRSGAIGGLSQVSFNPSWSNYFKFGSQAFLVSGYLVYVDRAGDDAFGSNEVAVPSSASGTVDCLVFLEVWSEEVNYQSTLHYYGCENSPVIQNNLLDSRVGGETTRRVQLKSRIRVERGEISLTNINAQGSRSSASLDKFTLIDGDTAYYSSDAGSCFGAVYAIPLFIATINTAGVISAVDDIRPRVGLGVGLGDIEDLEDDLTDAINTAKNEAIGHTNTHEGKTGGVHGVPAGGRVESVAGAQSKATTALNQAKDYTDSTRDDLEGFIVDVRNEIKDYTDTHETKTVGIHGIPPGQAIESVSGAQAKATNALNLAKAYTDDHSAKIKNVHGIGAGDSIESVGGAQTKANNALGEAKSYADNVLNEAKSYTDNHEERLGNIHGVGSLDRVESVSGAQTKANNALNEAKAYTDARESVAKAYTDNHENKANPHSGHVKKSGDTMTGILKSQNNTSYTTFQVRNIYLSTGSPSDSLGGNGDIWIKYE